MSAPSHKQIFLSAVSAEFRSYRDLLASDLNGPHLDVKVQEDFVVTGGTTLEKLDAYIQGCDAILHLIGDATGAIPPSAAVQAIRRRYPDLLQRLPALADAIDIDPPVISYTQWEAYLAIYHRKRLHIYQPAGDAPRDADFKANSTEKELQEKHFQRIHDLGRDRGRFTNQERLSSLVLRDLQDVLPPRESVVPPAEQIPADVRKLLDDAWANRHDGKYEDAQRAFTAARVLAEQHRSKSGAAKAKYGIACLLNERRENPQEARSLLNESLRDFREAQSQDGVSRVLHQLGILEAQSRNFDEARAYLKQSLEVARKQNDEGGVAHALDQLAQIEYQLGRSDDALKLFDEALTELHQLYQDSGSDTDKQEEAIEAIAGCHHHKGIIYDTAGEFEQAESSFLRAAEWHRKSGALANVGRPLYLLARLKYRESDFTAADKYLQESCQLFLDCNELRWAALCMDLKGRALFQIGQRELATYCFTTALNLTPDAKEKAEYLNKLGRLSLQGGSVEEARQYFAQAREISEKEQLPHELGVTIRNMAALADTEGKDEERDRLFIEAISVLRDSLRRESAVPIQAKLLGEIGAFYEEMGNYSEALLHYQKARRIYSEMGEIGGIANTMGCIARMKHFLGNDQEEFEIYRELKRVVDGTPYYELIAGTATNLGVLEMRAGNLKVAKQLLDEAEHLCEKHYLPIIGQVRKNKRILERKVRAQSGS
jgi:tetratricopeptide (TPR) repeat protein